MRKRPRPSFLRHLERRYGPDRDVSADGDQPRGKPVKQRKPKLPRVYPVSTQGVSSRPREAAAKGVIDMTIQQFVSLAIFFVLLACAGSAVVAYGVVEATGSAGPQGLQGLQGVPGEQGIAGERGPQGLPGAEASQEMVKRLAALWAVQQASFVSGGAFVEFTDPTVSNCVEYVLTGVSGPGACPGFSGGTQ